MKRPKWEEIRRESQVPPGWPWFVWLILAGRGWGKTRVGAEWAADKARKFPGVRIALVAQAFADGRDTMVEGESGLLSVLHDSELRGGSRDLAWNRSMGELFLANGSRFKVYSSEKPRQLRGPQHHFAWADEPSTWYDAHKGPAEDTTWSNLVLGCRLSMSGSLPQIVASGTPKPVRLLTQKSKDALGLLHRKSTAITRGSTSENLKNLAQNFRQEVVEPLVGTRLGRQELEGEVLEDVEGALVKRDWIEETRVMVGPEKGYRRKVLGLDPADGGEAGAEQAMTLMGIGLDHKVYVKRTIGMRERPAVWLRAAVELALAEDATIVIEKNHGGEFLVDLLEKVMAELGVRVSYTMVTAAKGKTTRAEKLALLYEQKKVHHIGQHTEYEDQLCSYTGAPGEKSPDRLDSAVWAHHELSGYTLGPQPSEDEEKAVPYGAQDATGAVPWR